MLGHSCSIGLSNGLVLALLAVLSAGVISCHFSWRGVPEDLAHLPLCKPQIHLASPLGSDSLVILQASSDDARRDGKVMVVAVLGVR
jgi:hypothetical protein